MIFTQSSSLILSFASSRIFAKENRVAIFHRPLVCLGYDQLDMKLFGKYSEPDELKVNCRGWRRLWITYSCRRGFDKTTSHTPPRPRKPVPQHCRTSGKMVNRGIFFELIELIADKADS